MTEPQSPVLVVATVDAESRGILERELRVRYGSEYTVLVRANYDAAEHLLRDLAQQEQPIAFILACYNPADRNGIDFLGRARAIQPTAKRAIAVTWGDFASSAAVFRAMAEGKAELALVRPEHPRDEEFHGTITDALVDWQLALGVGFEAVRLIATERDARSHLLRDCSTATTFRWASTPLRPLPARARSPISGSPILSCPSLSCASPRHRRYW